MYVWLDSNDNLNVALSQSLAPSNAIFIDTSAYNPVPPVDALVSVSNGQIVVNSSSQVLQILQKNSIKDLSQKTTAYILKHYPEAKQRADVSDITNGETYLASQGIDITALRKSIGSAILNATAFSTALATLNQTYNTNSNATISYWLTQVLKVSYRQYFVYQVKQEYYTYLQEIQQATSLPLPTFEFKTPFPTLE